MKKIIVWLFFILALLCLSVSKSIPERKHTGKIINKVIDVSVNHMVNSYHFNCMFDSTIGEMTVLVSERTYQTYKESDIVTFKVYTNREIVMISLFVIIGLAILLGLCIRWLYSVTD